MTEASVAAASLPIGDERSIIDRSTRPVLISPNVQSFAWWNEIRRRRPSFDVHSRLDDLIDLYPAASSEAFVLRIGTFLPAFRQAIKQLAAQSERYAHAGNSQGTKQGTELWAVTAILTAFILQQPYVRQAVSHLRPFQSYIDSAVKALQKQTLPSLPASDVRHNVLKVLILLCPQNPGEWRPKMGSSVRKLLDLGTEFCLASQVPGIEETSESDKADTDGPDNVQMLLQAAAERTLNLWESRAVFDGIQLLVPLGSSFEVTGRPYLPVRIAAKNPQVGERLYVQLATEGSDTLFESFSALGTYLPVNTARSFDVLSNLYSRDVSVEVASQRRQASLSTDVAASTVTYSTSLRFAMWKLVLPAFTSRCLSSLTQAEEARKAAASLNVDGGREAEGANMGDAQTSKEIARDVERLLDFIQSTDLYRISESPASILTESGLRSEPGASSPPQSELRAVQTAAQAVVVELKSFALGVARYREAANLLRMLTAVERVRNERVLPTDGDVESDT